MNIYAVEINGINELIAKLEGATKDSVIKGGLTDGALFLTGWVKKNRLTGPRPGFLGVKTGDLRASISAGSVDRKGNEYSVAIGTNKVYAAIHEFGGIIRPKNKPFLAWKGADGKYIFARKVVIPSRPFLRPALQEQGNQDYVLKIMLGKINTALEGQSIGRQAIS